MGTTTIASTTSSPPVDTTADPETDAPIITTAAPSCPPGFRDNDPSNPGTNCEDQCVLEGADYCQNGGTCSRRPEETNPLCVCGTWYTGDRCESLNPLLIGLICGLVVAVIIILVAVMVVVWVRVI